MKIVFIMLSLIITASCSWPKAQNHEETSQEVDSPVADSKGLSNLSKATFPKFLDTRTLRQAFADAAVDYPPKKLSYLAFKEEKRLEVWARDGNGSHWRYIREYPILGSSGVTGPKLREGDGQVPEGIYRITYLNPHSQFHLSMKLNYPNSFDLKYARREGRRRPGSNIFIHGSDVSVGCLAMGDAVIEEVYHLTRLTGIHNARVIIAPRDIRVKNMDLWERQPYWVDELYAKIHASLQGYPLSAKSSLGKGY